MKLAVIAVGSLKEKYYREACAEYSKRMTIMRPIEVIEVSEEPVADEDSLALVERALEREGRRIIGRLHQEDLAIALTPDGDSLDSGEFARMIDPSRNPECKRMVFIIGSSHGLGKAVYERCRRKLSFGPMTFPHQLARVMLLEQIYRGQMIQLGRAYHK
ncbi:MAG: 23S rRNA (pseudouridine(1915)-N(3))-methyltransferase RlmH [Peptococcaceae bacterium]|nr:23S rRNA (pseudouridine(1915)-N(3))-methyltransferase RlmH [Peptococcaceae bacterium]